ncbi:winged helix-turn-helix transcriptional regulator [Haloquadratum walsbyi]|uniref:HTH domain protein n=1 Tax=Haloquadratum walsbyi (strain DSM 16854 / JCM 12705 / C23) TaxID=768065 RepID=G0LKA5_HALWC|nr:winged helix-turn-helix transcriptional regulator [Haloquadratum walsbyi]CCC39531.1 HTH domain protein [Haloquadratum walsbyi C23]
MGNRNIDENKRATLRRFATIGAASPLAVLGGGERTTDNTGAERTQDHEQTGSDNRNEVRKAIVGYVSSTPGVHFSKIRDELKLGTGETQHHLRRLVDDGKLTIHRDGDYKRFYLSGRFNTFEQVALGFLRRTTPRGILIELLKDPTATGADLATVLDVSQATVSTYSSKLDDAGLISRTDDYTIKEPEIILTLILRHADSLGPDAVAIADEAETLLKYSPQD